MGQITLNACFPVVRCSVTYAGSVRALVSDTVPEARPSQEFRSPMRANSLYALGSSYAADFPSQVTSTLERHFHRTLRTCQLDVQAAGSLSAKMHYPIARSVALWASRRRVHIFAPIVYPRLMWALKACQRIYSRRTCQSGELSAFSLFFCLSSHENP